MTRNSSGGECTGASAGLRGGRWRAWLRSSSCRVVGLHRILRVVRPCREATAARGVFEEASDLWNELVAHVAENDAPITELWSFAGARFGWFLRLRRKDRVVLYMTPQVGRFLVGVVLGEPAAEAALQSGLPEPVRALIESAPRYAEGRGIRFAVATSADLAAARKLAAIKLAL